MGNLTQADRAELKGLLQQRWESLPPSTQTPLQMIGRTAVSCGATHHVMEKCNFSCTCCYLGPEANQTEPLPFEEVQEQLDHLRAELGPQGRVQITAGEVTLLPLADLGRIVQYGISIGLDLMVMSHGQRFLDEPDYLIALVRDYGLRKISIHIDSTQRGRPGANGNTSERELHRVREGRAQLVRRVRRDTGLPLYAASTVTVTNQNLEEMSEVMGWFFRNADAFRILSFQPVADVGRTRKGHSTAVLNSELWKQVFTAAQRSFNTQPVLFGHSKCNNVIPLLVARAKDRCFIFEGLRKGDEDDLEMFSLVMARFLEHVDWDRGVRGILSVIFTPSFFVAFCRWAFIRMLAERKRIRAFLHACWQTRSLPRLHPFLLVAHNFMSPSDLTTEEGKERLDACMFKLSVDGKLVSMCEMNASELRSSLDRRQINKEPSIA